MRVILRVILRVIVRVFVWALVSVIARARARVMVMVMVMVTVMVMVLPVLHQCRLLLPLPLEKYTKSCNWLELGYHYMIYGVFTGNLFYVFLITYCFFCETIFFTKSRTS